MRRSRIRWAIRVIAPWCLGVWLLVSITADAGQNASVSGSYVALSARAVEQPDDLVPLQSLALTGDLGDFGVRDERLLLPVSFDLGQPEDLEQVADELQPRADLKANARTFPTVDRTHKGDPAVALRPSFDTRLRRPGGLVQLSSRAMLSPDDDARPASSFSRQETGAPLDGTTRFAAWADGEDPQDVVETEQADLERAERAAIAMRPAALKQRLMQGATPKVPRAEALASATPAPADGTPIEVTFSPEQLQAPNASLVPGVSGRPNYAALLVGDRGARERKCLAEAVYFEARSEPEEGQAAVAQVVLNRATSGLYPASICGVVYQNRTHYRACQFSFACEGRSLRINEPEAWRTAVRIADSVVEGRTYLSDVGGATHYHANYVRPYWARRLVKMDVIGHHIFYKLRPGQS